MQGLLDQKGKTSSMRVSMMLCVFTACYLCIAGLHLGADLFQVSTLVGTLLVAGFGGKVAKKGFEKKDPSE